MIGSLSDEVTGLFNARFFTPAGAIHGARGLPDGFSAVVPGGMFLGVPVYAGLGSLMSTGAVLLLLSSPLHTTAKTIIAAANVANSFIFSSPLEHVLRNTRPSLIPLPHQFDHPRG